MLLHVLTIDSCFQARMSNFGLGRGRKHLAGGGTAWVQNSCTLFVNILCWWYPVTNKYCTQIINLSKSGDTVYFTCTKNRTTTIRFIAVQIQIFKFKIKLVSSRFTPARHWKSWFGRNACRRHLDKNTTSYHKLIKLNPVGEKKRDLLRSKHAGFIWFWHFSSFSCGSKRSVLPHQVVRACPVATTHDIHEFKEDVETSEAISNSTLNHQTTGGLSLKQTSHDMSWFGLCTQKTNKNNTSLKDVQTFYWELLLTLKSLAFRPLECSHLGWTSLHFAIGRCKEPRKWPSDASEVYHTMDSLGMNHELLEARRDVERCWELSAIRSGAGEDTLGSWETYVSLCVFLTITTVHIGFILIIPLLSWS